MEDNEVGPLLRGCVLPGAVTEMRVIQNFAIEL